MFKLDMTCPKCGGNQWNYFEKYDEGDWIPRFWKCVNSGCPGEGESPFPVFKGRTLAYCFYIPYGAKEPEDYLLPESLDDWHDMNTSDDEWD